MTIVWDLRGAAAGSFRPDIPPASEVKNVPNGIAVGRCRVSYEEGKLGGPWVVYGPLPDSEVIDQFSRYRDAIRAAKEWRDES